MGNRHFPEGVVDAVGVSISTKTTWGGAITGFLGWLAQVNWIGLAGVMIAGAGLAANLYFQHRRDKREQADREDRRREHEARMLAIQDRCEP